MNVDLNPVSLAGICRHFGRRRALSTITLTVRSGEIVGLLGPNGAGKSTLIGVLATLVAPTSGQVQYGGRSAREIGPALRRHIGLLAHELHLYPELSARQNLAFFAELYGLDRNSVVDTALEQAGLADRGDDPISSFSRGMRQRVALERALLHQPQLVLFDEPFTGLDDQAVGLVADRLRRLAAAGCVVFVATHDLDLADGLVTRVAASSSRMSRQSPAFVRDIANW